MTIQYNDYTVITGKKCSESLWSGPISRSFWDKSTAFKEVIPAWISLDLWLPWAESNLNNELFDHWISLISPSLSQNWNIRKTSEKQFQHLKTYFFFCETKLSPKRPKHVRFHVSPKLCEGLWSLQSFQGPTLQLLQPQTTFHRLTFTAYFVM
jgi:hypothetical protein